MDYRRVGSSGLKVSAFSFGGWLTLGGSVERSVSETLVRAAIDLGINFVDLADVYSGGEAERVVGEAIRGLDRTKLVLSSKVFFPMSDDPNDRGLGRKHIFTSIDRTLRRLGTDHLDIYFCHREDPDTPLEETAQAMTDLVRQGKILYWGTSEFGSKTLLKLQAITHLRSLVNPSVEQPQYNLLHRGIEKRLLPIARHLGTGIVVWSPLAGGLLTGKYEEGVPSRSRGAATTFLRRDLNEANLGKVKRLKAIALDLGCTPAQLALAWILRRPEISSVILGATSLEQLTSNVKALEVQGTEETWQELERTFPR
ncbi:MAG: aldo/keto reductase family protein [Deltaproteobacteria bacterium]|nr:aldo/keto reductase family protein [Deltaproteobacteria bacterium]